MGRAVLFAGKDELIETLRFAYDTSLNNPNTYVDGFISEGSYIKDSFLYMEIRDQRFTGEFEYYSPQSTRGVQIGGTIEGVLNENRVHIKDDSLLLSILYPAGEKPINSVGLYGMGLLGDHLDIGITISNGETEGTFGISGFDSYKWTLEELDGEYVPLSYKWE